MLVFIPIIELMPNVNIVNFARYNTGALHHEDFQSISDIILTNFKPLLYYKFK